jgi:subtilase family serine protease
MNRCLLRRALVGLTAVICVVGYLSLSAPSASAAVVRTPAQAFSVQHVGSPDVATSREFTVFMRKGTSASNAAVVAAYFKSYGMTPVISPSHRFVWVTGTLAQAAAASHSSYERVQITQRSLTSGTAPVVKFGPFTRLAHNPTFPSSISGLISATTFSPGPKTPSLIQQLPNPEFGFAPADMNSIYDVNPAFSAGLSGAGVTVAVPECGIANQTSINYYTDHFGLPTYEMHYFSVDGTVNSADQIGLEPLLDAERIIGTAPGAKIRMYFINGFICDLGEFGTMLSKIAEQNNAQVASISYGLSEATWAAIGAESDREAWQAGIQGMADDGMAIFASSGDSGAFSDFFFDAIDPLYPSSDPNVISAGGTTLVESAVDTRLIEDAWYSGGGGVSGIFPIPSWQQGVPGMASSLFRNTPDVSMDADPNTGVQVLASAPSIGIPPQIIEVGGTSVSAPSLAGIYALVMQNRTNHHHGAIVPLAPALYALNGTNAYFDVTTGYNGYYPATKGYDDASGLGAPDAWNLIKALQ